MTHTCLDNEEAILLLYPGVPATSSYDDVLAFRQLEMELASSPPPTILGTQVAQKQDLGSLVLRLHENLGKRRGGLLRQKSFLHSQGIRLARHTHESP